MKSGRTNPDPGKEATAFYLPMMQGSKAEQRKWWLSNRMRYMDSKWNAGDALREVIQLRAYATDDITVTPYTDIYPTIKYGSYLVQKRGSHGVPVTLECPVDALNDTEVYIYSAPQLASIGDLSGLKVGVCDVSFATKLQSLKLGDSSSSYRNPNLTQLTLGSNALLKTLDVRNCPNLVQTVDLSQCANIEEIYMEGTKTAGVQLPNGGVLKKLHLPATITNLEVRNQSKLTDIVIGGYTNITTLWIENPSDALETVFFTALDNIAQGARLRVVGLTLEMDNVAAINAFYDKLDRFRGLDEYGNNMDKAQVTGTIHIASARGNEIAALYERYPYMTINADSVESTLTYKSYDGATTLKTVTCLDGVPQETGPSGPSRSQTAQYTYTFVGWNTQQDAQTAESGCTTNVVADRIVYAAYSRTVRTYTVTWKNSNGTVLETDENVPYGSTPHYDGATPQNPTSGGGNFVGWSPAVSTVTGNVTYTASYIPTYTVRFYNGTTLLETKTVQQGQSATYTGETPVNAEDASLAFTGWSPNPTNVQANMDCYAQFQTAVVVEEITDTWDQILAACANGTAATKYKVGNYKPLDLGTEGIVNMQIVAKNKDALASGSGNAPLSWVSMETQATKHRMNPDRAGSSGNYTEGTGAIGGWEKSEMRTYLKNTVKPLIPQAVRSGIKEVTKYSQIYNSAGSSVNNVSTTDDVWIPSGREVFGNTETSGPVYTDLFADANSCKKSQVGATSASWWWLRSASGNNSFFGVGSNGGYDASIANYSGGVALGFCT